MVRSIVHILCTLLAVSCAVASKTYSVVGKHPFSECQVACEGAGARMLCITTAAEQAVLMNIITSYTWIGLEETGGEGHWEWIEGCDSQYLDGWAAYEPNNFGGDETKGAIVPGSAAIMDAFQDEGIKQDDPSVYVYYQLKPGWQDWGTGDALLECACEY